MVVVIAITFIVFWSPQYIVIVISQLQEKSFLREGNFIFTMLMTHFFGFLNSCLNPIIYTAMSQKFRRSFKEILQCVFFCCTFSNVRSYHPSYKHGSSHRFTSTVRHTLSDTEGHHVTLNDGGSANQVYFVGKGQKNSSRSSSSGAESDIKTYHYKNGPESKVIKKYIFKNNSYSANVKSEEDLIDRPLIANHDQELKGILKNSKSGETFVEEIESPAVGELTSGFKETHGKLRVTYN